MRLFIGSRYYDPYTFLYCRSDGVYLVCIMYLQCFHIARGYELRQRLLVETGNLSPSRIMVCANKDSWCCRLAVNQLPLWQEVRFCPWTTILTRIGEVLSHLFHTEKSMVRFHYSRPFLRVSVMVTRWPHKPETSNALSWFKSKARNHP